MAPMVSVTINGQQVDTELKNAASVFKADADEWFKVFCVSLFNEMATGGKYSPGTPVDTGYARANWSAGIGAASSQEVAATDQATVGARAQQDLLNAKIGDVIEFRNNAHYIRYLEYGTSRMAPRGFVRAAVAAAPQLAQAAVRVMKQRMKRRELLGVTKAVP